MQHRPPRRPIAALLASLLLCGCSGAFARIQEEQFDLPVEVTDAYGKRIAQPVRVTVWSDDSNPRPAPVMVLGHGRAPDAQGRASLGRARYTDASRFFVQRGFIVAVPTRVGYGVTGGEDVEDTGSCQNKRYAPGYAAAAQETLQVLQAVRRRPDAAPDRAVVAGQSYGGATALAVGALQPAGVQAVLNFAGGGGGNPRTQPGRPCAAHLMERLLADYGKTLRIPTLWMYADNDLYFGPTQPRAWFDAFRAAGGQGEFVQFPPQGEDGHSTFVRFPQTWQPPVAAFLDRHGFAAVRPATAPASSPKETPPHE